MPRLLAAALEGLASPGIAAWLRRRGDPLEGDSDSGVERGAQCAGYVGGGSFACEADVGVADRLEEPRLPVGPADPHHREVATRRGAQ
jgi:hypothetical protein